MINIENPLTAVGNWRERLRTLSEKGIKGIVDVANRDIDITKAFAQSVQADSFFAGVAPLARLDMQKIPNGSQKPSLVDTVTGLFDFQSFSTQLQANLASVPTNYVELQVDKIKKGPMVQSSTGGSQTIHFPDLLYGLLGGEKQLEKEFQQLIDSTGTVSAQTFTQQLAKLNLKPEELAQLVNMTTEFNALGELGADFLPYATFLKKRLTEELARGIKSPQTFDLKALPFRLADLALVKGVQSNANELGSIEGLPSWFKPWLKSSREAPYFSVTLEEAKDKIAQAFGQNYQVDEAFRSASVGNVFFGVHKPSGTEVAIKVRHPHVNPSTIIEGREALRPIVKRLTAGDPQQEVILKSFDDYYTGFLEEANFNIELARTQAMMSKQKNAAIPQPFDATEDLIVTERIKGLSLGDVIKFLQQYQLVKKSGVEQQVALQSYQEAFQAQIAKYPFLADPEKLGQALVDRTAGMLGEQFECPVKSTVGSNTYHDDLHPGNIMLRSASTESDWEAVLIDHGGAGSISVTDLFKGVRQGFNTMIGNSQGLANDFVDGGVLTVAAQAKNKDALKATIAQALASELFQAGVNVKSPIAQQVIQDILERNGVLFNPDISKYLVSFLKGRNTLDELQALTGKTVSVQQENLNRQASLQALWDVSPVKAVKTLAPTVGYVLAHPNDSRRVAYQFFNNPTPPMS